MKPSFVTRANSKLATMATALRSKLSTPAPVRPMVLLQSDDWGNAGIPDAQAMAMLNKMGMPVPVTPWDAYGLEDETDLQALGELLLAQRDAEGQCAVMSAVTIVANADVTRMLAEGYREFHAVPVSAGFPAPWQQRPLADMYRQLVASGAWYPALHGYTHLNQSLLLEMGREDSTRGKRMRALHALGIPCLTSQTPEMTFALLDRSSVPERFLPVAAQREWLAAGIAHFERIYGRKPLSTCAPGYRFNTETCGLWAEAGIPVVHSATAFDGARYGVWNQSRNVFFEPVLQDNAVERALQEAARAVQRGEPITICSHSINYVSRHVGRAGHGRAELGRLLTALRQQYPDLRFAHELASYDALQRGDRNWWRVPTAGERLARLVS